MTQRNFRYRLCDVHELTVEEIELTVAVTPGETVRGGDGRLMLVFAVVPVEDEAGYAGVLMVEPTIG